MSGVSVQRSRPRRSIASEGSETNLGTLSAAGAIAGDGATRAASDAAGAGREGSTTISIFIGRSVVENGMTRWEKEVVLSVAVQRRESKQKEQDDVLRYAVAALYAGEIGRQPFRFDRQTCPGRTSHTDKADQTSTDASQDGQCMGGGAVETLGPGEGQAELVGRGETTPHRNLRDICKEPGPTSSRMQRITFLRKLRPHIVENEAKRRMQRLKVKVPDTNFHR